MKEKEILLSQSIDFAVGEDKEIKKEFDGVAYTGAVIKNHGWYQNLAIDIETLKFKKTQVPIFRDHDRNKIVGYGFLEKKDGQVLVKGKISESTPHGQEVLSLAKDGFKWEMSVGLFDFDIEEINEGEVNGNKIKKGFAARNANLREVSFVALGADSKTKVKVFKETEKEGSMEFMSKEDWIAFACSCGGTKESKPSDLEKKFADAEKEKEDLQNKLKEMAKKLKDAEAKAAKAEKTERKEKIEQALKEKGIKMSEEKIESASDTELGFSTLISIIEGVELEKKEIKKTFTEKLDFDADDNLEEESPEALMLKANKLVEDKKAADLFSALKMLGGK